MAVSSLYAFFWAIDGCEVKYIAFITIAADDFGIVLDQSSWYLVVASLVLCLLSFWVCLSAHPC